MLIRIQQSIRPAYLSGVGALAVCDSRPGRAGWDNTVLHITVGEFAELKRSLATLEDVLQTLDTVGAGIAAIHVDAAINQLKSNMEAVALANTEQSSGAKGPPPCPSEHRILML